MADGPRFYVNWSGASSGFIIGRSSISTASPAVIGSGSLPLFNGIYDDVTSDVLAANWKRGRSQDLVISEAGEMSWTLKDRNASGSYRGRYNRDNPASPLVTGGNLRPMRAAKIVWRQGATDYPIAYGYLRTTSADARTNERKATFQFIDIFEALSHEYPVVTSLGATTVGAAIGALLDAAGYTGARSLDVGPILSDYSLNVDDSGSAATQTIYHSQRATEFVAQAASSRRSVLDAIAELVQISGGMVFMAADGTMTFKSRIAQDGLAAFGSLSSQVQGKTPGTDLERVFNACIVTGASLSGPIGYVDDVSSDEFGLRTKQLSSDSIPSNDYALMLAAAVVADQKDPDTQGVAWGAEFINQDATTQAVLRALDLGKVLTVVDSTVSSSADYIVEAIEGSVVPGGPYGGIARMKVGLRKRNSTTTAFWIRSASASNIGGTDAMKFG